MPFKLNLPQAKSARNTCPNRRRFLQLGVGATTTLVLPKAFASLPTHSPAAAERKIALLNLHTGES